MISYKYRLYPSRKQRERLFNTLKICKQIYNELLEISISTYKSEGKTLRKFDYNNYLSGKYTMVYSQVKQNVSDRVHKAFKNFFRRVKDKSCKKKGFPRFKSKVNSITYPQSLPKGGFKFISDKRLYASKIGSIPIVLHRAPKGVVKTLTIKRNRAGQWFAIFACEVAVKPVKNKSKAKIGIDVGIESFATTSEKEFIENPHYLIKAEKRLKLLQRRVSRKKKGSKNRRKACFLLAKQHINVANQRLDFLHKLSRSLTERYGFIAVEDLNINGMVHNHHLAKHINDASWNSFIQMLSYKAIVSGGQLVKVNPRNTSKTCNRCGTIVDMSLNERRFNCPSCGFVSHRDLNSALNILNLGLGEPEVTLVDDCVRPSSVKATVCESRTICG